MVHRQEAREPPECGWYCAPPPTLANNKQATPYNKDESGDNDQSPPCPFPFPNPRGSAWLAGGMAKYKLTIAYDGTAWQGWQAQRSGLGVQNAVHRALAELFPSHPEVTGSSRTDAGVHAR